jgi:hypothetical protein
MAVSIVFIVGAFANSERAAAITTDQSNLEVSMRQITDYIRQTYIAEAASGYQGIQYIFCAKDSTSSSAPAGSYAIPGTISLTDLLSPTGPVTAWSITVKNGQSADRKDASGNPLAPPPPFMDCGAGAFNPPSCSTGPCDWGVQQLIITVDFKSNRSLTRTVFKSEAT